MSSEIALELRKVTKRYPGTLAVDSVDMDVRAGEVHALLGENGAGKSTLVKLIAGSFSDYTGEALIAGREVKLHSPAAAKGYGIEMIHQELSLAPSLSLAENILAGRLPTRFGILNRRELLAEARRCLDQVGLGLDPDTLVEQISQHEAQLVEIAKALGNRPRILVMDEPTSALSREEVERLFVLIRRLREQGLAIIYISHHLPELHEIADRITILRDGKKVVTTAMSQVTSAQLVNLMVGRLVSELYPQRSRSPGEERLRVSRLTRRGFFHDVSFAVRGAEILGIGGLSGAGRSELVRTICGIDPLDAGTIFLDGREVTPENYGQAIANGFAYLTEDRKSLGLALRLDISDNMLAGIIGRISVGGFYWPERGSSAVQEMIDKLQVNPPDAGATVGNLSGGNQQKVLLAKWLVTQPQVLILDEPTRGVDVAAKAAIHRAIAEAADRGIAVILISSDLPELVGLADRILILRKGHLIGRVADDQRTEDAVLLAANGEGTLQPA